MSDKASSDGQDWGLMLLLATEPTDRALAGWIAPSRGAEDMLREMARTADPCWQNPGWRLAATRRRR